MEHPRDSNPEFPSAIKAQHCLISLIVNWFVQHDTATDMSRKDQR